MTSACVHVVGHAHVYHILLHISYCYVSVEIRAVLLRHVLDLAKSLHETMSHKIFQQFFGLFSVSPQ